MKTKLAKYLFIAQAAIILVLMAGIAACTSEPTDTTREAAPSQQPATGADSMPRPVVISADVVSEFAASQAAINEDWDQFHVDFDRWRAGLIACDRTAAEAALRVFASDFGEITQQARQMPGKGIARNLPDDVISAATAEETSLRLLRDQWQPGDPTLLEETQSQRASAAALLRTTEIAIDELQEMDDPEDREIAKEFSAALEPVDEAWETFYDSYADLGDQYLDLTLDEIVSRLRVLADDQEEIVAAIRDIPSDKVTDPVQDPLIEAAELEEEALGDLLDAFRKAARAENAQESEENGENGSAASTANGENGEATESEGSEEPAATETEAETDTGNGPPQEPAGNAATNAVDLGQAPHRSGPNTQGGASGPPAMPPGATQSAPPEPDSDPGTNGSANMDSEDMDYSVHFDTFEDVLDETRPVRRKAGRDLEDLLEGFSEQDREALADFTAAFASLMADWDDFHAEFDDWVRTEGDCNRASAVAELNDYNRQFSDLSSRVRELSQASYLRPSSDLLSEAVDREGAALRSLASTWAPYESDVYRGLDEERSNADKLRRLAARRTQELMERNGIQQ